MVPASSAVAFAATVEYPAPAHLPTVVDYARTREVELLPKRDRSRAGLSPAISPVKSSGPSEDFLAAAAFYLLRLLLVTAGICLVNYEYGVLLWKPDALHHASRFAFDLPTRYVTYGAIFLTATTLLRRREHVMAVAVLPCLHHLYVTCSQQQHDGAPLWPFLVAAVAVVPILYFLLGHEPRPTRRQSVRFWGGLIVAFVIVPKGVQAGFHLPHGSWLDVHEYLVEGMFLRYAYYFYERQRGLVPPGRFWEHVAYMFFIPQITGMLNFPPSEMAERWSFDFSTLRRGFVGAGWVALEIPAVLWIEQRLLPVWGYSRGYAALRHAPVWSIWICLLTSYFDWAMLEIVHLSLMVTLFRFFGVNLDDNFRWPFLATSPVQLWRRWNLYSRKLLLKFVYFPLGGNQQHVYRNILLTFLASALLLHTGYIGSAWLTVDPGQLRDWLLYFAAQGLLVCAAYWWQKRPFWQRLPTVARGSLAAAGWAFTLLSSAWLHVIPLAAGDLLNGVAPIPGLWQRLALMARALGW